MEGGDLPEEVRIEDLLALLVRALGPPPDEDAIRRFQRIVWEGLPEDWDRKVDEILGGLAYDLEWYRPEEAALGDEEVYGYEGLERMIKEAFGRLKKRGVAVPLEPE
jgi:hypothetical protein